MVALSALANFLECRGKLNDAGVTSYETDHLSKRYHCLAGSSVDFFYCVCGGYYPEYYLSACG
jgi:hypothetical protein